MTIPATFVDWLECPSPKVIFKKLADKTHPLGGFQWELHNEIRPVDLYCYLYARFGPPNGFQNFLRQDDSDNLIHWEWTLAYNFGYVSFQGMNFRTEVLLLGELPVAPPDREEFISQLKADFRKYGPRISEIRNNVLEKW